MAMKWRVVNDSAVNLCVGTFGIENNMQARLKVPAGQTRELRDQNGNLRFLSDGHRAFIAWDDFTDEIKGHNPFLVNSSSGTSITLKIFDNFGMDVSFS